MNQENKYIQNYLDFYIKNKNPKNYAILLSGEWGSGKTHLIKEYIEKNPPVVDKRLFSKLNKEELKFVYISLYGVSETIDIESQIFHQVHPVLSSDYLKYGVKLTKIYMQFKGIESDTLFSFDIKKVVKNPSNLIFIFDDLERCSMSVADVMGFINHLCEHNDYKCIILANEFEIKDSKNYYLIKEKLIGRTFNIKPNVDSALTSFIKHVDNEKIKSFLNKNIATILHIFEKSTYNNLRSLKQAITEFSRLIQMYPPKAQASSEFMLETLKNILILVFEIRKSSITNDDLLDMIKKGYTYGFSTDKKDEDKFKKIEEKYSDFSFYRLCPDITCWYYFFKNGEIPDKMLTESINSSIYFDKETRPDWLSLVYFSQLDEKDFSNLIQRVRNDFSNGLYTITGEIKHIVSTLIYLSRYEVIQESVPSIVEQAKEIIQKLSISNKIEYNNSDDPIFNDVYHGIMFLSRDDSSFKEVSEFIDLLKKKDEESKYPELALRLISLIQTDSSKFQEIILQNYMNSIPIFKHAPIDSFITSFLACPNSKKRNITYGLKNRYQYIGAYKNLLEELKWWKCIQESFLEKIKTANSLEQYHIKHFLEHFLDQTIKDMEEIKLST